MSQSVDEAAMHPAPQQDLVDALAEHGTPNGLLAEMRYEAGGYHKRPIRLVRGDGAVVEDDAGRQYIDCCAGIGVVSVGHANPRVVEAIARQAARLTTCPEIFSNDVRADYLSRLVTVLPDGLNRVFLCNSGTEAVEAAIKLARMATGRMEIVAAMRGFHGRTLGALSATWEPRYRTPFAPLVPGFHHVRYNDAAALAAALSERTAAVVLEIVQGEGGVRVGDMAYLQEAARLCHAHDALLIVDEVQTGFGRTGHLWACEHADIVPDILCLAKGIANGIPMGATCLGPRVPSFPLGAHGSTFGGNPLACAAASATLRELLEQRLAQRAADQGAYLLSRLRTIAAGAPVVREVRGLGLMIGIELRTHVQSYLERLAERGVLALTAGTSVIRLLPPLIITSAQIEAVRYALEEVLR
jgi:acetylornithine/LysW-gamma-L-lysine aminotransferase